MLSLRTIPSIVVAFTMTAALARAQQASANSCVNHESLEEAWWTGPLLANSAATLPRGHFLIEPYLYDVIVQGHYDHNGFRRTAPHANSFGSLTYMLYGIADRVSVGLIPTISYNEVSGGLSSSGVGLGDLTVQAQYRLTQFHEGGWIPTTSVAVQETFPTGKYDRLADRPSNGFGSGAYTTTLALYSQTYFWLSNGRILRMRFNASQAFSNAVKINDESVYGTGAGFHGRATAHESLFVDGAWEYSLTQRWVLALDATYGHNGNIRVAGYNILERNSTRNHGIQLNSGSSDAFGLAPAVEYSWNRNLGMLVGVRVIPAGRNTAATITPAVAINFVH